MNNSIHAKSFIINEYIRPFLKSVTLVSLSQTHKFFRDPLHDWFIAPMREMTRTTPDRKRRNVAIKTNRRELVFLELEWRLLDQRKHPADCKCEYCQRPPCFSLREPNRAYRGKWDWNFVLYYAAKAGSREICTLAIEQGATDWSLMLGGALKKGQIELCTTALDWSKTFSRDSSPAIHVDPFAPFIADRASEPMPEDYYISTIEGGFLGLSYALHCALRGGMPASCQFARNMMRDTTVNLNRFLADAAFSGHETSCIAIRDWALDIGFPLGVHMIIHGAKYTDHQQFNLCKLTLEWSLIPALHQDWAHLKSLLEQFFPDKRAEFCAWATSLGLH